jgi:hypothetical protein
LRPTLVVEYGLGYMESAIWEGADLEVEKSN